ncbi:MAG: nucleotidyltransferase domain-containing protein, partial [Gemmatimonadota bacterium]
MRNRLATELPALVEHLRTELGSTLVTVCLFGSQVLRFQPDRDVDLLVVLEEAPDRRWERSERVRAAARAVNPELEAWLSPIVLTPVEAERFKPYYLGILGCHRLLFDRRGFFAGVLDRLQARLDELGARRLTDPDG